MNKSPRGTSYTKNIEETKKSQRKSLIYKTQNEEVNKTKPSICYFQKISKKITILQRTITNNHIETSSCSLQVEDKQLFKGEGKREIAWIIKCINLCHTKTERKESHLSKDTSGRQYPLTWISMKGCSLNFYRNIFVISTIANTWKAKRMTKYR